MNAAAYGFRGRVIAYGLNRMLETFRETAQFADFLNALRQVGGVELLDALERYEESCRVVATAGCDAHPVTFRE